jgi:hypothetical protein
MKTSIYSKGGQYDKKTGSLYNSYIIKVCKFYLKHIHNTSQIGFTCSVCTIN